MFALIALALTLAAAYLSLTIAGPFAFAIAAVGTAGIAFFEFATASALVFRGAVEPIGHLRIEPRAPSPGAEHQPEPAYRSYYLGPVFRDYALAVQRAGSAAWRKTFGAQPTNPAATTASNRSLSQRLIHLYRNVGYYVPISPTAAKMIAFGPFVGAFCGLAAGVAAAAAVGVVITVVFGLVIALIVVAAAVVAVLMRGLELAVLRVRGITIECPSCHRKATAPTYLCPHCPPTAPALHRRLIPGAHGVFFRICRCGNTLPTLLARGKGKLEGRCQYCQAALPVKSLSAPTLHIPVVAARQAGKTVFMTAGVAALERHARSQSGASGFEFADRASVPEYVRARDALGRASFGEIRATIAVDSAPAFNIYLGTGRARRLMYLYDAAGERFELETGVDTLRYLEHAGGVVVIVDPFSFPEVRRSVEPAILHGVRHSLADVDDVLSRFAEGLRRTSGTRAGRRLNVQAAVVLTKCDALLRSSVVPHPYDALGAAARDLGPRAERSNAVQRWLGTTAGQGGLLSVVQNTFTRSEYFAVSAADAFDNSARRSERTRQAVRNDDPAEPLQWLLGPRGRA